MVLAGSHLRAVAVQPTDLDDLDRPRMVRVWWNGQGASLELGDGEQWRTTDELEPGALVPSSVLVRLGDEVVQPVTGLDPSGVARLFAPEALPGREVADVVATAEGAWVAVLDGGLVYVSKDDLRVRSIGVAEGLPSAQVNAVAVFEEQVHAGTAAGLFRQDGHVWTSEEGLPDDWVQALYAHGDGLYVGTYRGLALLREGFRQLLGPLSVFWIGEGSDQRRWAGYDGLQGLPQGEPIEGVGADLNVWDVDHLPGVHYLATDAEGILVLRSGIVTPLWSPPSGAVYALHREGERLYAAADDGGLVELSEGRPIRRWGRADGLPSELVYEVEGGPPGKLWVGTDDGLALLWPEHGVVVPWPRSPVAAGVPGLALLADERFVLAGTDEGVASLGRLPRGWRDVTALPGPIVGLERDGATLWVVGERQVWKIRRGRVERFVLPVMGTHAALVAGNLWVGSDQGLYRLDGGLQRFVPGPRSGPVRAMTAAPDGLLWVAAEHRVLAVARNGDHRDYLGASPTRDLCVVGGQVLLATRNGLERLDPGTAEVRAVAGFEEAALAVEADGAVTWVLDASLRVRAVPTGLPRPGLAELWTLGEVRELHRDAHGRLWALGERGFALL